MNHRLSELLNEPGKKLMVAKRAKMPPSTITALCNGKMKLHIGHIEKLAKALEIEPYELLVDPKKLVLNKRLAAMVEAYEGLSDRDRMVVDSFLFPDTKKKRT